MTKISNYVRPGAAGIVFPSTPGSSSTVSSITDGVTTVAPANTVDFTSGATVTDLGGGVAGVAISTSSVPWSYAKANGGLHGDGITDDTALFQAWITSVTASGTKSGWFWFEPGTYLIAGALADTGAFNGQVLLPNVSTSNPQITLTFQGPARPPLAWHGTAIGSGYAVIKSTLTGATGTAACISGGNTGQNNIEVVVRDLLCTAPDNPTFTFWNLGTTQGGLRSGLMVSTTSVLAGAGISQPTHTNAYGVKLPQTNNSNLSLEQSITVYGFYTGILHGELVEARYNVSLCEVGVEVPFCYHPGGHMRVVSTATPYGIRFTGGANYVDIWYDAEHCNPSAGGPYNPAWAVIVDDIDDGSNYWHGHCRWQAIVAGTGAIDTFTVNGGSNAHWEQIGALPAGTPSFATPAIVLGTAAAAGAATTAIRSDSTIVAFTSAVPLANSGSGSAGSAAHASREDHVHPASTGTVWAPLMVADADGTHWNVVVDGFGNAIVVAE